MAVSQPSGRGGRAPKGGTHVRTSVRDGRKYVNSDELIKREKVRKQMERLQEIFESSSAK